MAIQQNILLACDTIVISPDRKILLIQRKNPPFQGCWALPGGFAEDDEDLAQTAQRELLEETSISLNSDELIQFGTYGKPGRDPRARTVSVVYYQFLEKAMEARADDDAAEAQWFPLNALPTLAFDHGVVVRDFIQAQMPEALTE